MGGNKQDLEESKERRNERVVRNFDSEFYSIVTAIERSGVLS